MRLVSADAAEEVGVVVVDDQPFFRVAAREVLEVTRGFQPMTEVSSGEEAVSTVARLHPDLVLLDVRMPGMDGIEAAARITREHPDVVVVLISIDDAARVSEAARTCGAVALVRKQDFGPALLRSLWATYGRSSGRRPGRSRESSR